MREPLRSAAAAVPGRRSRPIRLIELSHPVHAGKAEHLRRDDSENRVRRAGGRPNSTPMRMRSPAQAANSAPRSRCERTTRDVLSPVRATPPAAAEGEDVRLCRSSVSSCRAWPRVASNEGCCNGVAWQAYRSMSSPPVIAVTGFVGRAPVIMRTR
jgi:hypothetical protein